MGVKKLKNRTKQANCPTELFILIQLCTVMQYNILQTKCNKCKWNTVDDLCNGRYMGRTSSAPESALHLSVDKDQGLRSGSLTNTSHVLHPVMTYAIDSSKDNECKYMLTLQSSKSQRVCLLILRVNETVRGII